MDYMRRDYGIFERSFEFQLDEGSHATDATSDWTDDTGVSFLLRLPTNLDDNEVMSLKYTLVAQVELRVSSEVFADSVRMDIDGETILSYTESGEMTTTYDWYTLSTTFEGFPDQQKTVKFYASTGSVKTVYIRRTIFGATTPCYFKIDQGAVT